VADELFVIFHRRGPRWDAGLPYLQQPLLGDHIGFMRSLVDRGLMRLGGPFMGDGPDDLVGMAIVRADDLAAAKLLAAEDPSIATGLIVPDVRPWRAAMGDALEDPPVTRRRLEGA
jgi:hypothetical protein